MAERGGIKFYVQKPLNSGKTLDKLNKKEASGIFFQKKTCKIFYGCIY